MRERYITKTVCLEPPSASKTKQSLEIQTQVKAYIANGGKIQPIYPGVTRFSLDNQETLKRKGVGNWLPEEIVQKTYLEGNKAYMEAKARGASKVEAARLRKRAKSEVLKKWRLERKTT